MNAWGGRCRSRSPARDLPPSGGTPASPSAAPPATCPVEGPGSPGPLPAPGERAPGRPRGGPSGAGRAFPARGEPGRPWRPCPGGVGGRVPGSAGTTRPFPGRRLPAGPRGSPTRPGPWARRAPRAPSSGPPSGRSPGPRRGSGSVLLLGGSRPGRRVASCRRPLEHDRGQGGQGQGQGVPPAVDGDRRGLHTAQVAPAAAPV